MCWFLRILITCQDYLSIYLSIKVFLFYNIDFQLPENGGKTILVCLNNVILSSEYSFLVDLKCKYKKWFETILSYANAFVAPKWM